MDEYKLLRASPTGIEGGRTLNICPEMIVENLVKKYRSSMALFVVCQMKKRLEQTSHLSVHIQAHQIVPLVLYHPSGKNEK
jgi:hypothetical protein